MGSGSGSGGWFGFGFGFLEVVQVEVLLTSRVNRLRLILNIIFNMNYATYNVFSLSWLAMAPGNWQLVFES